MNSGGRAGQGTSARGNTSESTLEFLLPEPLFTFNDSQDSRPTVVFRSRYMGDGGQVLGERLVKEFLLALLAHPEAPRAILCFGTAVQLALDDSPYLDQLHQLAERGCEILICRTSLQSLAPGRQPSIGRAAALAELVDRMRQAHLLLWP
jgi:hypothetical protein